MGDEAGSLDYMECTTPTLVVTLSWRTTTHIHVPPPTDQQMDQEAKSSRQATEHDHSNRCNPASDVLGQMREAWRLN